MEEGSAVSSFLGVRSSSDKSMNIVSNLTLVRNMLRNVYSKKLKVSPAQPGVNATNMKTKDIVLDSKLLGSSDPKEVDAVMGAGLHELMHVMFTEDWEDALKWKRPNGCPEKVWKQLLNILEDERIEMKPKEVCPGYVPYLAECKKHYLTRTHSATVEISSIADEILVTLLYAIRYPASVPGEYEEKHRDFILHLQEVLSPYPEEFSEVVEKGELLWQMMKEYWEEKKSEAPHGGTGEEHGEEGELDSGSDDSVDDDKDEEDEASSTDLPITPEFESMEDEEVEELPDFSEKFLDALQQADPSGGNKPPLKRDEVKAIEQLERNNYERMDLDEDESGLSEKHVVDWNWGEDDKTKYGSVVQMHLSTIGQLRNRMDFYGLQKKVWRKNQEEGTLDGNLLHSIPNGNGRLFKQETIQQDKAVDIVVLCDESGSMSGMRIRQCRAVAVILREAMKTNQKVNLWFFGHTADVSGYGDKYDTQIRIYETPQNKSRQFALGKVGEYALCNNRDGVAIQQVAKYVNDKIGGETQKLFFVISDGQPSAYGYSGYEHTKKMVVQAEKMGFNMMQVAIGGYTDSSKMFKHFLKFDERSFANDVVKLVQKVLHI